MDFLCSNLVKTIFTYWIGTVFNLILQSACQILLILVKESYICLMKALNRTCLFSVFLKQMMFCSSLIRFKR